MAVVYKRKRLNGSSLVIVGANGNSNKIGMTPSSFPNAIHINQNKRRTNSIYNYFHIFCISQANTHIHASLVLQVVRLLLAEFLVCGDLTTMRPIFIVMIFLVALITSLNGVDAGRVLNVDIQRSNHIDTYTLSIYKKTKNSMTFWLQMLASGPSPRGIGH